MAKGRFVKEKKRRFWPFLLFMLIYAAVVLVFLEHALGGFWNYIAAYEESRPKHVLNAYMDRLNGEHVSDLSGDVIAQIDHNIQSEEACREYIVDSLSAGFSYAKKSSESTDTRQVYVLRTGTQTIGQFVMEVVREDEYGFTYWEVTEESFDMSYLIGTTVSATAPDHYTVSVNGTVLDSSYLIGDEIKYDALKDFYDDYDLPAMVTYQAGPFLGDFEMVVTDPEGNAVDMDAVEDLNVLAQNCTESEIAELDGFVDQFIEYYVAYLGGANRRHETNLKNLLKYVVSDSDLAGRMKDALEGLRFAQSRGDEITEIHNNYFFKLEDGKYLCDVRYLVDTTGREGVVETVNKLRIIIVETDDGLLVQSVYYY